MKISFFAVNVCEDSALQLKLMIRCYRNIAENIIHISKLFSNYLQTFDIPNTTNPAKWGIICDLEKPAIQIISSYANSNI